MACIDTFPNPLQRDDMTDKILEEVGVFFEHPQGTDEVVGFETPGGFEAQALT
jgi:hypothetical protein